MVGPNRRNQKTMTKPKRLAYIAFTAFVIVFPATLLVAQVVNFSLESGSCYLIFGGARASAAWIDPNHYCTNTINDNKTLLNAPPRFSNARCEDQRSVTIDFQGLKCCKNQWIMGCNPANGSGCANYGIVVKASDCVTSVYGNFWLYQLCY